MNVIIYFLFSNVNLWKKKRRGHLSILWFIALGALSGEPTDQDSQRSSSSFKRYIELTPDTWVWAEAAGPQANVPLVPRSTPPSPALLLHPRMLPRPRLFSSCGLSALLTCTGSSGVQVQDACPSAWFTPDSPWWLLGQFHRHLRWSCKHPRRRKVLSGRFRKWTRQGLGQPTC